MGLPYECEPFYKRPFLICWLITSSLLKFLFYIVIPTAFALFIIVAVVSVILMTLSNTCDWPYDSVKTERRREEEKEKEEKLEEEKRNKEEGMRNEKEEGEKTNQDKLNESADKIGEEDKLVSPVRAGGALDTLDMKKRLEFELELLVEMAALRRERLDALEKAESKDDASFLEVEARSDLI